jgi:hypothetical protein
MTPFERIDTLLNEDTRSRWRIIVVSAFSIAGAGLSLQYLAREKVSDVHPQALVFGTLVFVAQIAIYMFPFWQRTEVLNAPNWIRSGLNASIALAASAILAILASVSAPAVEAAVLNRRLTTAISSGNADTNTNNSVVSIASIALHDRVRLQPSLVTAAAAQLRNERTDSSWAAYVGLLNYVVNWRANSQNDEAGKQAMVELDTLRTIARNCGPENGGIPAFEWL